MILENGFLIKTVDGMTEEMFFDLCQANSELRMERDQHGNISIMSPMGLSSGNYHSKIIAQLWLWSRSYSVGAGVRFIGRVHPTKRSCALAGCILAY